MMTKKLTSPALLVAIGNFVAGKRVRKNSQTAESPVRQKVHAKHSRQFPSFDRMMMSAGHQKNGSSVSTAATPTKSTQLADITLGYRENPRNILPSSSQELETVWTLFFSALQSHDRADLRFPSLLLLRNLLRKGNLDLLKALIFPQMQHEPKQAKLSVTKAEFLNSFDRDTRHRIERWLYTEGGLRAVMEFCRADDTLEDECFEEFHEDNSVISESLCGVIPAESDSDEEPVDPMRTPPTLDHGRHGRTVTTIYHDSEESPEEVAPAFSPGPLVTFLIWKLAAALEDDAKEAKVVMVTFIQSAIDALCRYPYVNKSSHVLFSFLLDVRTGFHCETQSLVQVLHTLEREINSRIPGITCFQTAYRCADGDGRKPNSRHMSFAGSQQTPTKNVKPVDTKSLGNFDTREIDFVRVRPTQRVESFDRFLSRLVSRVTTMESVRLVKESCLEDWVYDMRKLDA